MTTERLTPTAIQAAMAVDDQAEHDAVAGQVVCNLAFTRGMVADLAPREWEELASYLYALINRAPVKDAPAYAGHRMVLGSLASELRGYAQQAGEAVGVQADLRSTESKAEERRIRARIADEAVAFDRQIDDVIATHRIQRELPAHEPLEDDPTEPETAAPAPQADEASEDDLAYL